MSQAPLENINMTEADISPDAGTSHSLYSIFTVLSCHCYRRSPVGTESSTASRIQIHRQLWASFFNVFGYGEG